MSPRTSPRILHRPRRSLLYMPASNPRALEKARTLPCDGVILDLEDAVAPDAKPAAREQAAQAVRAGGFGRREVVIRCNGLETPWGADDLKVAAEAGPDAILVPKVNGPADIRAYEAAIAHAPPHTRLWAMIETCPAVFALNAIGAAGSADPTSRLSGWCMGLNDLAKEMGCRQTAERTPMLAVLTLAVAAARAHGLFILDGVCNELDDPAVLEVQCRQGVDFGFDGKSLIHPNQIETANRLYSPPVDEVAWARAVIAAFADPMNRGKGALRVEGKLAEFLHLAQAEKLVATADAIAAAEGAGAAA